ncbi:ORF6C domain-containing protein [Lachnospiraceae bacterium LCP25S3_G4]
MNELKIFENAEFGQIRTVQLNNEPYFCMTDICKALDISNISQAKTRLKDGGVISNEVIDSLGRRQQANFINESNMYKLIFQSRKESAERFTEWVTSDVLPSIRKTGTYHKKLSNEEMMRIQLGMVDNHEERIEHLENNMTIDYGQQQFLKKAVNARVMKIIGGKESNAYRTLSKKVFSECNHDIQDFFHVNSRNNIPKLKYEEALSYVLDWEPCINTKITIRDINAQLNLETA